MKSLPAPVMALVPLGVVTVTSTSPVPAGATAVIRFVVLTVKLVAGVAPNLTAVAPLKAVPVRTTVAPPAAAPLAGDSDVTVGMDGSTVNEKVVVTVSGLVDWSVTRTV